MQVKVKLMPKIDEFEREVLSATENGNLKSVATKAELAKFKAATRAIAVKDRRVNIRLSSGDLTGIQVRALAKRAVSNLDCECASQVRHQASGGATRRRGRPAS